MQSKKHIMRHLFSAVAFLIFVFLAGGSTDSNNGESNKTSTPEYSEFWRTDSSIDISRALVKNNIRGCGQYKYRPSSKVTGKFEVRCTSDGNNWTTYAVYVGSEKVIGPL